MFIGREKELNKLNQMYQSDKFEFAVIYGRRRVGKTTLIKEFCKNKRHAYYVALEADNKNNLANFGKDICLALDMPSGIQFNTWEDGFDFVVHQARQERLILVIDEYPYLAGNYSPISSILQAAIDHKFSDSKLFLILCGSSMSFMEYQVLGYKSPLYGRRTAQFKLHPFNYFEAIPFFESYSNEDKAVLYGITGGIPDYMAKIDPAMSVRDNIINLYFTESGHFYEEPSNLIKQELREPATYNSILGAIASGASRLNEISTKTGMESNKCGKYLTALLALEIVKKDTPVAEESKKKSIYFISDQMFRFWYRYVFPNMTLIVNDKGDYLYDLKIAPQINHFMGPVFENICRDYLYQDKMFWNAPFLYGKVGRWWGTNPKNKCQEEIDVVAADKENILLGECKWNNEKVDLKVLEDLIKQGELFYQPNQWYYLFSKNGFTDAVRNAADKDDRVCLIAFDEMNAV